MNFIYKIFKGKVDNDVHLQFQKFSVGTFTDKAIVNVKKAANGQATISTSPEFANEFIKYLAMKLGSEEVNVKGAIITTVDIDADVKFDKIKQYRGIKQYLINTNLTGERMLKLLEDFPKAFFGLSFKTNDEILTVKAKPPKSKPGKDEVPKPNFCKLKTKDLETVKSFIFETDKFKDATFVHDFIVDEIIIPDNLKNEKDYAKIREGALRKGKVIRHTFIDGKKEDQEKELLA
jgi:hypothetical protein